MLVDRFARRSLLAVTTAVAGAAVLLLLLVQGAHQVWLIYAVMVLYGVAFSILSAGQSALLTAILPAGLLADANGALRTIQGVQGLVAPLAGAGLFTLLGADAVILLDAATFAVALIALLALRVREQPRAGREHRWRDELLAGARHIRRTAALRQVVAASICAVLGFGFSETVVFAVVGRGLHRPAPFVGVLVAIQGLGSILAGLTGPALVRRAGERSLIAIGLALAAAGAVLESPPVLIFVVAGVLLTGLSISWVIVALMTLLQRSTPAHLQGRVYAAADALITTPQTISIAVGAALIAVTGYRALLGAMALADLLAAGYLVLRPLHAAGVSPVGPAREGGEHDRPAEHDDPPLDPPRVPVGGDLAGLHEPVGR